jgi:hypothetical protein
MALRPNTLQVISSTQIELGFNKKLSTLINVDNFSVSSSVGLEDSIKILDTLVSGSSIVITTNPQVSGTLYLLILKDTDQIKFTAEDGDRLANDDVSRSVYFVGADSYNPIRDRIFLNVPKTYSLDGSSVRNILSAQAEDLYQVEKHIGEILSDNYISVRVEDEYRIRGSGAKDRLAHENAYLIESISKYPSGRNLIFKELYFNSNSNINSQKFISDYPISLQQELHSEEIIFSNLSSNISGYLLKLEKNNIIKLESLSIIKEANGACDQIEYIYNIEKLNYSIKNNKYDPYRAFSYASLESNEILLSESSGFILPSPGDTIKISYLYKDVSRKINLDSILVYNTEIVTYEAVPQESTRFFLKNAPITNQSGELGVVGDLNISSSSGAVFLYEIPFNTSKLPSSAGEYAVNYQTGEVIVFGGDNIFGTSDGQYYVDYFYRKTYNKNLDYYIDGTDFAATSGRSLQKSFAIISFSYQQQFVDGVDYKSEIHTEVLNEQVEDNLLSTFTIKTNNGPITKVFSIYNQTSGETYQPVSFYKNEINFSGINPPKFLSTKNAIPKFDKVQNEKITPYFKFLNSIFKFKIIDNSSLNNIVVYPPIPSHLINTISPDYLLKDADGNIKNMNIKFFAEPDGNLNINSFALTSSSDLPDLNAEYYIGLNCLSVQLENKNILNKQNDAIGSFIDASLTLSETYFVNEKCFFNDSEFYNSSKTKLTNDQNNKSIITITLANLQEAGDYIVDYFNGVIHVAVGLDYDVDLGYASYDHAKVISNDVNIITCDGAYRRKSLSDKNYSYLIDKTSIDNGIYFQNLNSSFEIPDNSTVLDLNGAEVETNLVTDDYLIYPRLAPTTFYGIYKLDSIFGNNSSNPSYRESASSQYAALESVINGGKNLFLPSFKIENNYLDLKNNKIFKAKNNSGYTFSIEKENFGFIYSIKNLTLNTEISDQTLDGLKFPTEIYSVEDLGSQSKIYIDANLNINLSNDYIKDSIGLKFKIVSYDSITGETIILNITDISGYIIPEDGVAKVVNEISLTETSSSILVNISEECLINNLNQIQIIYVNDFIPLPGTRLATWYSSGSIYYDYTYTSDYLVVSYEYGDNEINWQINNSISESEPYYVTYRYGALRDSLKNNFGLLTKIPFFTKFLQNTDREVYRKALQGTLEAFSRGPVISSFENLIEKFTEQTPEISESFFGSWILGRDLLNPQNIDYSGILKFESGKFDSGVIVNDNLTITTPAKTSINLDEGTFSCWVRNDWYGINNDANLTFDFSKMSEINFNLKINSNIFKDQNFELFMSDDRYGVTDWTGDYLSIYNYQSIENGSEEIGPFGITKYHDRLNSSKFSKHSISFSASLASTSESLSGFYRNDPGALSERLSTFGMGMFHSGIPASSRGYLGDGLEIFLSYYTSPFIVSVGDDNRVLMLAGALAPIINSVTERVYVLKIEDEDVSQNDIPNFDGPYIIRNCNCVTYEDLPSLEKFRDEDFNKIKIQLTEGINISYLSDKFNIIDDISGCKYVLEDGRVYTIKSFIDAANKEVNFIPNDGVIYGFYVDRIPDNQQHITQQGSATINSTKPSGIGIILTPVVSVIRQKFDSEYLYNFNAKPILVNFTTKNLNLDIDRNPILNKVSFKLNNYNFDVAYSDLLLVNQYSELFDFLNLNSWFNSEYGLSYEINGISDLNNKIFIGCLDSVVKNKINISKFNYSIEEGLGLENIYIGSSKVNPKSYIFTINKDLNYVYGRPDIDTASKSVYIWFDENCIVDGNSVGSWKFKSVIPNQSIISIGPEGYTAIDGYNIDYESVELQDYIEGRITTDGGFSYAKSTLDDSECPVDSCDARYRFCGQSLLEGGGWKSLYNLGSDLINTIIGGTEHNIYDWKKSGEFSTSLVNNIYRINNIQDSNSYLYLPLNCMQDLQYEISFKVLDFDESIVGSNSGKFSGNIVGNLIGTTIAEIFDGSKDLKISLAASSTQKYLAILDGISGSILDLVPFNWYDNTFNSLQVTVNKYSDLITIYYKNNIISRIKYSILETYNYSCDNILEPGLYIKFNDKDIVSNNFIETYNQISLDIDYIELNLISSKIDTNLEDNDTLLIQTDLIDFKFYNKADGYLDAYGYMESGSDIDTLVLVSDLERYIFDSGEDLSTNRISLYKDFYGYLNFRIYDSLYQKDKNFYNIATNIKDFLPGDFHHIGASWRFNTEYRKDEMHLFIDGKEVPSLYKFGGYVSPWKDSKVGDIAKDIIQDFSETKLSFYDTYNDGQVLAGQNYLSSSSANFDHNDIGRSIIIKEGGLASELNNKAFIISSVDGNSIYLLEIESLTPYYFTTSSSNIEFYRPPHVNGNLLGTIFSSTKFEIYQINCKKEKQELGGVLYTVDNGVISIVNNNVDNPKYRINLNNGNIDFLYKDINCNWLGSVEISDLDIWIENFGLNKSKIFEKINYSSNRILGPEYLDQVSGFITNMPEPIDLSSVKIKRILLDDNIPSGTIDENIFSFELENELLVSSEYQSPNYGRLISIKFDSDNIAYCTDGYSVENHLYIEGENLDGFISEYIYINENKIYNLSNFYTKITKISGNFNIIDNNYEPLLFSVFETNSITESNNSGNYADVYKYSNGIFYITTHGSYGQVSYELPSGLYTFDYPSYLSIRLPRVGDKLFLGSNMLGQKQLGGLLDEVKIITEMSGDTRDYQSNSVFSKSITEEFVSNKKPCPDEQTIFLSHFDNPFELQIRRLRNKIFLNTKDNFKYKLNDKDLELLSKFINDKTKFISEMKKLGYTESIAEETYVESHMADGGPLFNEARYADNNELIVGFNSVNNTFGYSGKFYNRPPDNYSAPNIFDKNNGTIEVWVSPLLSTDTDNQRRVIFDSYNIKTAFVVPTSTGIIELPTSAEKIVSITLPQSKDSSLYKTTRYDEISRSRISGRLDGGTGTLNNFANGAILKNDGKIVVLKTKLISNDPVLVKYFEKNSNQSRIQIYIESEKIYFEISNKYSTYLVYQVIDWSSNSWHKIAASWKANTGTDYLKLAVDGSTNPSSVLNTSISILDVLEQIYIGSRYDGYSSCLSRLDNLRISKIDRLKTKDSSGNYLDLNYSSNLNSVGPLIDDIHTSYLNNFEIFKNNNNYITITDLVRGIYEFDIEVVDDFGKINSSEIEDLIVYLVNKLKPSHTNVLVKFKRKTC